MNLFYSRPESLNDLPFHYCPGCSHGIAHRLVAEVIDELGVQGSTIGIGSVGCSVFSIDYFNFDMIQAAHGRAPAVATGVKRVIPDSVVFTYQGDGDLAAIGTAEIIHSASRGENITVIYINNAVYGMTGGQMAPTTIIGQKTKTTPSGRQADHNGFPLKVAELLSSLEGPVYIARVAVHRPKYILQARKAVKKAFSMQLEKRGFSLVEMLSICPANWGLSPVDAAGWLDRNLLPYYPLGEYKLPPAEVLSQ